MRSRWPIAAVVAALALLGATHQAHASSLHHAALVVEHSSGRLLTRCVAFLEDQISGMQLIERSGVENQTQQFGGLGTAVCQLDYEPQQVPPGCFGSGAYWQYFHRTPSGWVQSGAGASNTSLHDGDMDGWRYAAGAGQSPATISFNSVCPAAAAPATTVAPTRPPAATVGVRTTTSSAPPIAAMSPPTPTASATPGLEAIAPTSSPQAHVVLAQTGPSKPPSSSTLLIWLVLGGASAVLIALGAVNLRRRGP